LTGLAPQTGTNFQRPGEFDPRRQLKALNISKWYILYKNLRKEEMLMPKSAILAVLILACLTLAYAADISGKWTAEFDSQVGVQKYVFDFKVEGSKLTGTAISNIGGTEAKTPITEGSVSGNEVTFVENLDYQGMQLRISYKGTISGDEIKFSRNVGDQGGETFVARRAQ
jgi:opacity protein-like surface antigen